VLLTALDINAADLTHIMVIDFLYDSLDKGFDFNVQLASYALPPFLSIRNLAFIDS
jgi:hypothetical protein